MDRFFVENVNFQSFHNRDIFMYKIKSIPTDFQVTELIDLSEDEQSKKYHLYIMKKQNISTFEAIREIAKIREIDICEIGYAGLKDEEAITTQFTSLPRNVQNIAIGDLTDKYSKFLSLKYLGEFKKKIIPGQLIGNQFTITIRNVKKGINIDSKNDDIYFEFINYYDKQRFGLPDSPAVTHIIGKCLIDSDYKGALEYLAISSQTKEKHSNHDQNSAKFFIYNHWSLQEISFWHNSYESFRWNQRLHSLLSKDNDLISKDSLNRPVISNLLNDRPTHLPLNISQMKYIVNNNNMCIINKKRPSRIITKIRVLSKDKDELNHGMEKILLSFFLPSGCYATACLKQFLNKYL